MRSPSIHDIYGNDLMSQTFQFTTKNTKENHVTTQIHHFRKQHKLKLRFNAIN